MFIALNIFYFHTTQLPDTRLLLYLVFKYPKREENLANWILLNDDLVICNVYRTLGIFKGNSDCRGFYFVLTLGN